MVFSKTLKFKSVDLGSDVALMLTFDDLATNPKLFTDCFPVCFKVIGFGASGENDASITYQSQLAFIKPQVDSNDIVSASIFGKIDPGQETELQISSKGPPETFKFSTPVTASSKNNLIAVTNKIGQKCEMGVGFITKSGEPSISLLFQENSFGSDNVLSAQYTPVLRGYIRSDFQENQVIRAEIKTDALFKEDLNKLEDETHWLISRSPEGKYSIQKTNK